MGVIIWPMLDSKLSQIGFTISETRVYMQLLTIGPQPASIIAHKINFNRSSTYSTLTTLEKKGIVSSFKKNGIKCFSANDPNSLISYLDSKSKTIEYYRMDILSSIPRFRELSGTFNFKKPVVSIFEGVNGVKQILFDIAESEDEILAYLCPEKWIKTDSKSFLAEYKESILYNRKAGLKVISTDTPEIKSFFHNIQACVDFPIQIVHIKNGGNPSLFQNEILVYGNKVAMIHLEEGNEYGIIIESGEVSSTHKIIFKMVWNSIKG